MRIKFFVMLLIVLKLMADVRAFIMAIAIMESLVMASTKLSES